MKRSSWNLEICTPEITVKTFFGQMSSCGPGDPGEATLERPMDKIGNELGLMESWPRNASTSLEMAATVLGISQPLMCYCKLKHPDPTSCSLIFSHRTRRCHALIPTYRNLHTFNTPTWFIKKFSKPYPTNSRTIHPIIRICRI